jgi:hypothetical protein
VFVVVELRARDCLRASRSFSPLRATIPGQSTRSQIGPSSRLLSLKDAQGLRDLRARDWAALGDHGGGGRCFSCGKSRALWLSRKRTDGKLGLAPQTDGIALRCWTDCRNAHVTSLLIACLCCTTMPLAHCWHIHHPQ